MDLDTLSKVGEFLGGTVVIVSLLYLAAQARQSAQQQRSENYGRTVDRASSVMSQWASNPDLNKLVINGTVCLGGLDPYDRIRFLWQMNEIFAVYEFTFEQKNLKVLPPHVWERYNQHLNMWISLPGVREFWKTNPGDFSEAFTEYVNLQMQKSGLSESEAKAFWGLS